MILFFFDTHKTLLLSFLFLSETVRRFSTKFGGKASLRVLPPYLISCLKGSVLFLKNIGM